MGLWSLSREKRKPGTLRNLRPPSPGGGSGGSHPPSYPLSSSVQCPAPHGPDSRPQQEGGTVEKALGSHPWHPVSLREALVLSKGWVLCLVTEAVVKAPVHQSPHLYLGLMPSKRGLTQNALAPTRVVTPYPSSHRVTQPPALLPVSRSGAMMQWTCDRQQNAEPQVLVWLSSDPGLTS